jgi:hopanoid-associated phosphorylase
MDTGAPRPAPAVPGPRPPPLPTTPTPPPTLKAPAPPILAVCGLAFEAALAAGPGVVTVCGPGGLEAVLQSRRDWAGILSFGCAGALDPALAAGACILATGVQTPAGCVGADAAWRRALGQRLPDAVAGELLGCDAPLLAAADKARLWRACGARAVDMESHRAALAAQRHGVPFAACRVVLDPAWRSIPASALAGLRADGTTALPPLLRALATAPRDLAPLCALAVDALRARATLRRVRTRLHPASAASATQRRIITSP